MTAPTQTDTLEQDRRQAERYGALAVRTLRFLRAGIRAGFSRQQARRYEEEAIRYACEAARAARRLLEAGAA